VDYEKFKIAEYTHWTLYLNENQYYLGRVYIWSKRSGLVDLMDLTEDEQKELFEIAREVKKALIKLFQPDMFNWASLGNLSSQCHLHVIPRYKDGRTIEYVTFKDENWGKNYAPYDYNFRIPEAILEDIRLAIQLCRH